LGFSDLNYKVCFQDGFLRTKCLGDVQLGGGSIPMIDLIVFKRYPILYLGGESSNGLHYMTEAVNAHHQKEFERMREVCIDKASEVAQSTSIQEVDEMSPIVWKRMTSASSSFDYYEKLSLSQQKVIDSWEEKRGSLIQNRTQKEITKSLEKQEVFLRKSTRLLRVYVRSCCSNKSFIHNTDIHAILTVWDVSDDQINLIQEGSCIRLKNLCIKASRCDDKLQLYTNGRSSIERTYPQPSQEIIRMSGYVPRKYYTLLKAQLLSKQLKNLCMYYPEHDCIGCLLKSSSAIQGADNRKRLYLYLTDETGFLIRIEREVCNVPDSHTSKWIHRTHEFGQSIILALRDIRILPFDNGEGCAVGIWTESSSFHELVSCERLQELKDWYSSSVGKGLCDNLLERMGAQIPLFDKVPTQMAIIIGTVVSLRLHFQRRDHSHAIHLEIDIGKFRPIEAIAPIHVVSDLLEPCSSDTNSGWNDLFRNTAKHDSLSNALKSLSRRVYENQTLFRFVLRTLLKQIDCCYEVTSIKKVDVRSLAKLYLRSDTVTSSDSKKNAYG